MAHSENSAVFAAPPTAETPPPPPAHGRVWTAVDAAGPSYRPARRLAMVVMAALAVASATRAMAAASALAERELLGSLLDAPASIDPETLSDRVQRSEAIGWL